MNKIVTFLIFIISLIVILVTTYVYYINDYLFKSRNDYFFDTEKLGQFGDFIGGFLGTILTIIATIFIYKTYISQRNELQLQRELISQQQFETTFFNMLEIHRNIKENLSISVSQLITQPYISLNTDIGQVNTSTIEEFGIVKGKMVFDKLIEDFSRLYKHFPAHGWDYKVDSKIDKIITDGGYGLMDSNNNSENSNSKISQLKTLKFKYDIFHSEYFKLVGDYLRNVYHILKFLSDKKKEFSSNNINIDMKNYADIFQSQMSYMELALIFYNGFKFRKARKLIKEFNFIENVHQSNLLINQFQIPSLGNIKSK